MRTSVARPASGGKKDDGYRVLRLGRRPRGIKAALVYDEWNKAMPSTEFAKFLHI